LIALSAQDELREKLDSMLRKHQRYYDQLKILFVLDSIEAVKSSISREHGLAFLPYISVKEELYNKQFKIINIEDFELDMSVFMICKKNTSQPKVVDEFIHMFKQIGEKSFC
jgi:DNA-binding transcriptional LysR family regulator